MALDRLMFDNLVFSAFVVMVGCVGSKASVRLLILDDVVMHEVVKGGVFEFIGFVRMKNWIVLCEFRHDWF